jgi:hypothetical protein
MKSDWQEEETSLEDDECFDEDDPDLTQDDVAVIGSMRWERWPRLLGQVLRFLK